MVSRPLKPMEYLNYRSLGAFCLIGVGTLALILNSMGLQTLIQSAVYIILLGIGALATLGTQLIIWPQRFSGKTSDAELTVKGVDISLSHLTIHYPNRKDEHAKEPHLPYYVVNKNTKQAYSVRGELRELQLRDLIDVMTHPSKKTMLRRFHDDGIKCHDEYPTSMELLA